MISESIIAERTDDSMSISRENYINVYRVSKCYGGPEEGGWYYPAWECLASVEIDRLSKCQRHDLKTLLEKQYPPKCQLPYEEYWGTDADDHEVLTENRKAERETREIPRYE